MDGKVTQPRQASEDLQAVRLLLERLGIDPSDLVCLPEQRDPVPTFAVYIPIVAGAVSAGTRRTYGPYWNQLQTRWGSRGIDEPSPSEIKQLAEHAKASAVVRSNSRGGRGAAENFIAALRCLYRHAEDDQLVKPEDNPAARVSKPHRLASPRRALTGQELTEINESAASTGNDPELDSLLLRLHTETACRRGGALNLRPRDLDRHQCLVYLREKGDTTRWQPVSPSLMAHLMAHGNSRGAIDPNGQLLRYRNSVRITRRRYDYLWNRVGKHLPWVATQGISTHWIRHTTLTWVERTHGYATAQAFAGHSSAATMNTVGTTATYVKASIHDVALALSALTNEPHPLTPQTGNSPRLP